MACFGLFWLILDCFGLFWFVLVLVLGRFCLFRVVFARVGSFWLVLGSFWLIFARFGLFWLVLAGFG